MKKETIENIVRDLTQAKRLSKSEVKERIVKLLNKQREDIMKKQEKIINEYILNEDEAKFIKHCLNYCFHRAKNHRTPMSISEERINSLRKEFDDLI